MHIPDSYLDHKTAAIMGGLAVVGLGVALRQARAHLPARRVPLMGLAAAFVFAAQMLNFPIGVGASGHLVGSVLTAVLLGPSAAMVVISAVLIVQCLLFHDGGIMALGANMFNMGLVGAVGGWAIYRAVCRLISGRAPLGPEGSASPSAADFRVRLFAAAFAAWCTVVLASAACAAELSLAGTLQWSIVFPTLTVVHMIIGVGEALITALVLVSIWRTRPELLGEKVGAAGGRYWELAIYGGVLALGLALFVKPLASDKPDGLEYTAARHGLAEKAETGSSLPALAPDYRIPWIGNETVATSIAGGIGTAVMFGLSFGLARVLVPARRARQEE